jgi:hypothetical protein
MMGGFFLIATGDRKQGWEKFYALGVTENDVIF